MFYNRLQKIQIFTCGNDSVTTNQNGDFVTEVAP